MSVPRLYKPTTSQALFVGLVVLALGIWLGSLTRTWLPDDAWSAGGLILGLAILCGVVALAAGRRS